jgi:hypothetical protein
MPIPIAHTVPKKCNRTHRVNDQLGFRVEAQIFSKKTMFFPVKSRHGRLCNSTLDDA